jgi:hypothetical protein
MHRESSVLALVLSLMGCSANQPTRPPVETRANAATLASSRDPGAASGFYPLDIGNHWEYERILQFTIIPSGQTGAAEPVELYREISNHDLTGYAERDGIRYVVEEWSTPPEPGSPIVFYRQDLSGLYEADPPHPVPVALASRSDVPVPRRVSDSIRARAEAAIAARFDDPTARLAMNTAWLETEQKLKRLQGAGIPGWGGLQGARGRPGGVGPLEITRLGYPLSIEAHWIIRHDPRFECTVEGIETFAAHSGRVKNYRLRIDSELFDPDDRVLLYESPIGYIGLHGVSKSEARDENGNPIGTLVTEQIERLIDYRLVGEGRP